MERIKAYLDPLDFMLWISEELETSDWEEWQQNWAIPLGVALNLVMMIARANSAGKSKGEEEIFGADYTATGWTNWFVGAVKSLKGQPRANEATGDSSRLHSFSLVICECS
jgi:hypothetical protein